MLAHYISGMFIRVTKEVGVNSYVQSITNKLVMHLFVMLPTWLWELNIHKDFGHIALFILEFRAQNLLL